VHQQGERLRERAPGVRVVAGCSWRPFEASQALGRHVNSTTVKRLRLRSSRARKSPWESTVLVEPVVTVGRREAAVQVAVGRREAAVQGSCGQAVGGPSCWAPGTGFRAVHRLSTAPGRHGSLHGRARVVRPISWGVKERQFGVVFAQVQDEHGSPDGGPGQDHGDCARGRGVVPVKVV
jgi:hypothetical protein